MRSPRQFWASRREAGHKRVLQLVQEQEAQEEWERLRLLLQEYRSDLSRQDLFSPPDLDLVVMYLCDGSLLGDESHAVLRDLCHLELSSAALQLIYDTTEVVMEDDDLALVFLAQKNLPRLVWMMEVRRLRLYDTRIQYQDAFLDDQTKVLLELCSRFFRWDQHAGLLALWDEVLLMTQEEKEVFVALTRGAVPYLPSAESEALINEIHQAAELV